MYTLVRSAPVRTALQVEAPALVTAFVVAEVFYKFHSFTLECLAFLSTWAVVSRILCAVVGPGRKGTRSAGSKS